MLNESIQFRLAQEFTESRDVLKSFSFQEDLKAKIATDVEKYSACLFTDISGFSQKVQSMSPTQTKKFLDDYYKIAIPAIYKNGGRIDRIAGDGILSVFSSFFLEKSDQDLDRLALKTAEYIVETCHQTPHACKGALGFGSLLFCKTGLANVYEDLTVIGRPITVTYRLDSNANANQVVMLDSCRLAQQERNKVQSQYIMYQSFRKQWYLSQDSWYLKGVSNQQVPIYIQTYK